jgi:hypothetical protein
MTGSSAGNRHTGDGLAKFDAKLLITKHARWAPEQIHSKQR